MMSHLDDWFNDDDKRDQEDFLESLQADIMSNEAKSEKAGPDPDDWIEQLDNFDIELVDDNFDEIKVLTESIRLRIV